MKSDQIKHSLAVGPKSIQSRVYDRETGELISFVKMPLEEAGLVSREALAEQPAQYSDIVSDGGMDPRNKFDKPAAGTQVSKVWWDDEKLMAKPIPFVEFYKPAQQEPSDLDVWKARALQAERVVEKFMAQPAQPSKPWVGLTEQEKIMCRSYDPEEAVAKTEAKLREKNA